MENAIPFRRNFEPLFKKYRIQFIEAAEILECTATTAARKIRGESPLKYPDELIKLWGLFRLFCPGMKFSELFFERVNG